MRGLVALVTLLFALAVESQLQQADIESFPYVAALLRSSDLTNYQQNCGGSILNNRAVLTAGRCLYNDPPNRWRFRVGSNLHATGGVVHPVTHIALNDFDEWSMGWDIAIVHTSTAITYNPRVQPGSFAGPHYILGDNQRVTTVGWGYTSMPLWHPARFDTLSSHLQRTVSHDQCRPPYSAQGFYIQPFQVCSTFIEWVPGVIPEDKCLGDPGAPLVHEGVVVGIRSFALSCTEPEVPTVNTRVSSFIDWISENR